MNTRRWKRIALAVAAWLPLAGAQAQISAPVPVVEDRLNAVGFGISYGEQNDRDADFWGWSMDYSRVVAPR